MERYGWLVKNDKDLAAQGCFWRLTLAFFLSFIVVPVVLTLSLYVLTFILDFTPLDQREFSFSDPVGGLIGLLGLWIFSALGAWIYIPASLLVTWFFLRRGVGGTITFIVAGFVVATAQTRLFFGQGPFTSSDVETLFFTHGIPWLGASYALLTWICLWRLHPALFIRDKSTDIALKEDIFT